MAAIAIGVAAQSAAETWRGIQIAEEYRCAVYDKKRDYAYPQSVEREITRDLGGVYGPYTGTCFNSVRETDIEHIVAASEAHDSGLCAAGRRFAADQRNLTLAAPPPTDIGRAARIPPDGFRHAIASKDHQK